MRYWQVHAMVERGADCEQWYDVHVRHGPADRPADAEPTAEEYRRPELAVYVVKAETTDEAEQYVLAVLRDGVTNPSVKLIPRPVG
jgi:hypothetical protein